MAESFRPAEFLPGVGRVFNEGGRNDGLTSLGGALRRRGAAQGQIENKLLAVNLRRCSPPLPEDEVRKIAASVARYPIGGPDPLERAFAAIQSQHFPSRYARFLGLARELQRARPGLAVVLPLVRIAELLGCHSTLISRYRRRAQANGALELAGCYVKLQRAAQFRVDLSTETVLSSERLTKKLTNGLVRHPSSETSPDRSSETHRALSSETVNICSSEIPEHFAQVVRLAERGFRLFPCTARSKKPPLVQNWPEAATSEAAQLAKWATRFPEANWALATGSRSGVWVLDIDGESGLGSFLQLCREHGQIETLGVQTKNGFHLYWRWPCGFVIRNSIKKVRPGLDVRSDGGYVLCPPSIHPSGVRYSWLGDRKDAAIADAPQWLLDLVSNPIAPALMPAWEPPTFTELRWPQDVEELAALSRRPAIFSSQLASNRSDEASLEGSGVLTGEYRC
jgi:hypothetical protein